MENKTKFLLFILLQIFLAAKAKHWDDSMEPMFGPPPDLDFYIREGEGDPYYHAVCTAKDRCVTTCTADYQDGCVCYKDGTCMEQSVNRCHQCTDANVFAVFEGQRCPKRHPFICHHYRHHHHRRHLHRHHKRDHGMGSFCKVEKFPSCVCTENGDCSTKIIDLCNDCSNGSYLAVFVNSTCPDKSLKAVCNKTAGSSPPPTTCNYPYAYLCQAQDKNSTTCDLESAPQGCICYSNGNCVSQPVSACACQRPDIISVYTGEFCPTNCTGTPSPTPAEKSEEGESESSNEETTPANEENTEGESSEGESSVVLDNLEDEFSSKNPYRLLNCTLSGAYQCQNSDRNASNCSRISSNSCICDNKGSCISVVTNRCSACSKNEVATIYENSFCPPSNCSANTTNSSNSTNNSNASTNNSNASTNNSNASTNNSNASTNNSGNDSANGNTNSSVSPNSNTNTNDNTANTNDNTGNTNGNNPNTNGNNANSDNPPNGNNNLNNNLTPETGDGGNAPIRPTAAVPAQNFVPNRQ